MMQRSWVTTMWVAGALAFLALGCGAKSGLDELDLDRADLVPPAEPPPATKPPPGTRAGMTWARLAQDAALGVDLVGCGGVCDAYVGDTACDAARPVLCVRDDGAPNPGVSTDFYHGWIGGPIALTAAAVGSSFDSRASADAFCAAEIGIGFRMAEFHHPEGGWAYWGFGSIDGGARFWVAIDDQPANCWD